MAFVCFTHSTLRVRKKHNLVTVSHEVCKKNPSYCGTEISPLGLRNGRICARVSIVIFSTCKASPFLVVSSCKGMVRGAYVLESAISSLSALFAT